MTLGGVPRVCTGPSMHWHGAVRRHAHLDGAAGGDGRELLERVADRGRGGAAVGLPARLTARHEGGMSLGDGRTAAWRHTSQAIGVRRRPTGPSAQPGMTSAATTSRTSRVPWNGLGRARPVGDDVGEAEAPQRGRRRPRTRRRSSARRSARVEVEVAAEALRRRGRPPRAPRRPGGCGRPRGSHHSSSVSAVPP